MREFKAKMGQSGRFVIPGEYRRGLGMQAGDEIIMHLDDDGLHLYTNAQAVARGAGVGQAIRAGGTKFIGRVDLREKGRSRS